MIDTLDELLKVVLSTLGIFFVLIFLYRKYVLSILDPLFFFLVIQAFSIQLSFIVLKETQYIVNIILCEFALFWGFVLIAPKNKQIVLGLNTNRLEIPKMQTEFLTIFCNIAMIVIVIANVYLISQKGIALFSDDPSESKVTSFSSGGGLGIVRRINWGLLYFVGLVYMYLFLQNGKKIHLFAILLLIILSSFGGSKGALLFFIQSFSFISLIANFKKNENFKVLKKVTFLLIPVAAILVFYILFAVWRDVSSTFIAIGTRFLLFGDAMGYYYDKFSIKHFAPYSIFDFIYNELNGIFGFFRLAPYKIPLGYELEMFQANTSTVPVFGPNVPFYVKGHIYFGYVGAIVYSFLLGMVIGKIRLLMSKLDFGKYGIVGGLSIIFVNLSLFGVTQDSALFISVLFDTFIFSLPLLILSYFVIFPKMYNLIGNNTHYDSAENTLLI